MPAGWRPVMEKNFALPAGTPNGLIHVPAAIVKSCISGDFDLTFARVSIFLKTSSKNSS
jgi:hypothetical protein